MNDALFIALQRITPQHLLSRLVGYLAASETPFIKSLFIEKFANHYGVNMAEALEPDLNRYSSFNDFFTRALKPDARPLDLAEDAFLCPADGAISQIGTIKDGRIFQAKGQWFSCEELLGSDEDAKPFKDGKFATVYLSPKDYHRVHMPFTGTLTSMRFIPGKLFSVNQVTAREVPRLFARNERLVCLFDTNFGPMAVVLVGAMIVASIETVWAGRVAPIAPRVTTQAYPQTAPELQKGDEMGRFLLGSTAIILTPQNTVHWLEEFKEGSAVRMGQRLGKV